MDIYAAGINLFLIGKNVLIVMVPILMNKDDVMYTHTHTHARAYIYIHNGILPNH